MLRFLIITTSVFLLSVDVSQAQTETRVLKKIDKKDTEIEACENGDGEICYQLAWKIRDDDKKAFSYNKKACALNISDACIEISKAYASGKGVVKNASKASYYAKKGCDFGNFRDFPAIIYCS